MEPGTPRELEHPDIAVVDKPARVAVYEKVIDDIDHLLDPTTNYDSLNYLTEIQRDLNNCEEHDLDNLIWQGKMRVAAVDLQKMLTRLENDTSQKISYISHLCHVSYRVFEESIGSLEDKTDADTVLFRDSLTALFLKLWTIPESRPMDPLKAYLIYGELGDTENADKYWSLNGEEEKFRPPKDESKEEANARYAKWEAELLTHKDEIMKKFYDFFEATKNSSFMAMSVDETLTAIRSKITEKLDKLNPSL